MPVLDPCTEVTRLRERRREIVSGEHAIRLRNQTGDSEEDVTFSTPNLAELDREIERLERECQVSQGQTPRRTRFAKAMRFRPY